LIIINQIKLLKLELTLEKNIDRILKFDFLKTSPNLYKRCIIYVSPANERDAWIPDIDTRCRNNYFDLLFKQIAYKHPRFFIVDQNLFDEKFQRILKHEGFYILIDIKKSGLTLPHQLIKILCEEMTQKYNFDFNYLYRCIKNQRVLIQSEEYFTKCGMGLGMLNNMYTIINIIVTYIVGTDCAIFSDDTVFTVPKTINSLESNRVFYLNLIKVYEGLGFQISKKKSVISQSFVFLEDYYKTEKYKLNSRKLLRQYLAVMESFYSKNLADLKNRLYNYNRSNFLSREFWRGMRTNMKNFISEFSNQPFIQDWELDAPPYLGGFGFNCNPYMDYDLLFFDDLDKEDIPMIATIFANHKIFMENFIFHERDKVDLKERFTFENPLSKEITELDNIYIKKLYRTFSMVDLLDQLENSLNSISLYSLKGTKRLKYINLLVISGRIFILRLRLKTISVKLI